MLGGRKQILVADDENNLRRILAAQLQNDGYDVFEVGDGRAAIEALGEHHIDAVITDLRMPQVDGLGVLKHCQEHLPELPVILITAHGTVETAVQAMRQGAFDFISKPFDLAEIRNVIAKAVRTSVAVVASTRDHHVVRTFVKGVQVRFAYWGICQLRR